MTDPLSDRSVSLPPIPDKTGTPRPPRAPRVDIPRRERHVAVSRHYRFEDQIPLQLSSEGATGEGELARARANPILEEVSAVRSTRDRVREALRVARNIVLLYGTAGLVTAFIIRRGDWVVDHATIIAASAGAAFVLIFALSVFSKGGHPRWRASAHVLEASSVDKVWMYELTEITIRESRKGPILRLSGEFDRIRPTVALPLEVLEANQPMWDLVYNGLRHSAAAGARVDPTTRERLRLP